MSTRRFALATLAALSALALSACQKAGPDKPAAKASDRVHSARTSRPRATSSIRAAE